MTEYAFDPDQHSLVASWQTGVGRLSTTVSRFPDNTVNKDALGLSATLSSLSTSLWRCYTHPASAADSSDPNTEGWRRQKERDNFALVIEAIRSPNLPQDGYMLSSYSQVEEAAHNVGRVLHSISDSRLVNEIIHEVNEELRAIERAERGDLTGRAQQGVALTRTDVSPVQVTAANNILREHPLGSARLFEEVDAAAASVAAAHWLQAAAHIASEQADCDPTAVVIEADNIEALPVETPTAVLEMMAAGMKPRAVVTDMLNAAIAVSEGRISDPDKLAGAMEQARAQAEWYGPGDRELLDSLMPRLTPLNPTRPAHDLLEDLLYGIRGCHLLYRETADFDSFDDEIDGDLDSADPESYYNTIDSEFFTALTIEADSSQNRIL